MNHIQQRAKEVAQKYVDLAVQRCDKLKIPLTEQQQDAMRGAVMSIIESQMRQRALIFATTITESVAHQKELQEKGTEELADMLIDQVWSMMKIGSNEGDIVEACADRLRVLVSV